jgi:hypothetical protein
MVEEKLSAEQSEESPDQVAKTVFWIIAISTFVFVAGVLILIR